MNKINKYYNQSATITYYMYCWKKNNNLFIRLLYNACACVGEKLINFQERSRIKGWIMNESCKDVSSKSHIISLSYLLLSSYKVLSMLYSVALIC